MAKLFIAILTLLNPDSSARINVDTIPGWWFQTYFIFPYSWDDDPIWLSYFSGGWNHQPEMLIPSHLLISSFFCQQPLQPPSLSSFIMQTSCDSVQSSVLLGSCWDSTRSLAFGDQSCFSLRRRTSKETWWIYDDLFMSSPVRNRWANYR